MQWHEQYDRDTSQDTSQDTSHGCGRSLMPSCPLFDNLFLTGLDLVETSALQKFCLDISTNAGPKISLASLAIGQKFV